MVMTDSGATLASTRKCLWLGLTARWSPALAHSWAWSQVFAFVYQVEAWLGAGLGLGLCLESGTAGLGTGRKAGSQG